MLPTFSNKGPNFANSSYKNWTIFKKRFKRFQYQLCRQSVTLLLSTYRTVIFLYDWIICSVPLFQCLIFTPNFFFTKKGKISENCGKVTSRGLDEAEKRLATQLHNELRAQVARGEEIRGHPGPQPSASNMMQMVSALEWIVFSIWRAKQILFWTPMIWLFFLYKK